MDNGDQAENTQGEAHYSQSGLQEILSGGDASSRERLQRILDGNTRSLSALEPSVSSLVFMQPY